MRLARELPRPEGTCDCDGNSEAVITAIISRRRPSWNGRSDSIVKCCRGYSPEGTSEGGRDPLAGGTLTRCSITLRTSHVPAGLAAHVTAASGVLGGAERDSLAESGWSEPEVILLKCDT